MNKVKCLSCEGIIESKSIHDWVPCICFTDDEEGTGCFVDGGEEYQRIGCHDRSLVWVYTEEGGYLLSDEPQFGTRYTEFPEDY